MLPSHYQVRRSTSSDEDDVDQGGYLRQRRSPNGGNLNQQQQQPPLGLTGVVCQSHNLSIPKRGVLHYTVFRPRHIRFKPPLICVAGGPLLPCIYLQPLVHLITDRSIVFYDALGCGQSKLELPSTSTTTLTSKSSSLPDTNSPKQQQQQQSMTAAAVDIPSMVQDLQHLISTLSLDHFHLLGHSFGGICCYEYLKRRRRQKEEGMSLQSKCLSWIMVSTPVSIAQAVGCCHKLQAQIRTRLEEEHDPGDEDAGHVVQAEFARLHECRLDPLPLPLQQAFMGVFSSTSKGLAAVHHYNAQTESLEAADASKAVVSFPPCLILRGEHDFVSRECQDPWRELLLRGNDEAVVTFATIPNSSHFSLLENEQAFAAKVKDFLPDPAAGDFITLPNGVKVRR